MTEETIDKIWDNLDTLENIRSKILARVGEDYPMLGLLIELEQANVRALIEKIETLQKPQEYFTTLELYIGYTVGIDQALRVLKGEDDVELDA